MSNIRGYRMQRILFEAAPDVHPDWRNRRFPHLSVQELDTSFAAMLT
jgi:hypothetical protein